MEAKDKGQQVDTDQKVKSRGQLWRKDNEVALANIREILEKCSNVRKP